VGDLRVGKRIELTLSGERAEVEAQLREIAVRVLSNPVMEDVEFELSDAVPAGAA
jgi:phosphoribosylformylglycinamidine synthase subunit PurS